MTNPTKSPRWMRQVLLAAGAYNIVWGAFAVLFPTAIFQWLGMTHPNYPQFWQGIGMIVGVYGVGYAIAAFDPVRHWPMVLVGLLGKVLGPIGMIPSLWTGALPWTFALNNLTNDIIWWLPFALILKHAWHQFRTEPDMADLPDEATLLADARTSTGQSLAELSRQRPILLVFLRHAGCTFCREAMADISARRATIEAEGTGIVLVHMGTPDSFASFAATYQLSDLPAVSDPSRRLYRGLGLRRGTFSQLLGWEVLWRGARSFFSGHGAGRLEGDGTQLPGAFLIRDGRVLRRFIHANSADRPDYVDLCRLPAKG